MVERGVARSKIVERQAHPLVFQGRHRRLRLLKVADQRGLGDLDLEAASWKACLGQYAQHAFGEIRPSELLRRNVDGDADRRWPVPGRPAGLPEDRGEYVVDKVQLFGGWY